MPIRSFVGMLGGGKTLGMTAVSKELYDAGYKILANYHLTFGEMFTPLDLIGFTLKKCIVNIDEAYTITDSRYNTQASRLVGYFVKQSRKRDVWINYTSQRLMDVDVRIRNITDQVIYCEKQEENKRFVYTVIAGRGVVSTKILSFKNAEEIYKLYDTTEIIMPVQLENDFLSIEYLKELAKKCPNSQSFVEVVVLTNPFMVKEIARAIYALIKSDQILLAEQLLKPLKKQFENNN